MTLSKDRGIVKPRSQDLICEMLQVGVRAKRKKARVIGPGALSQTGSMYRSDFKMTSYLSIYFLWS